MKGATFFRWMTLVASLAAASAAYAVRAAAAQPDTADKLATYTGADRMTLLAAAAKKEGEVTVYSSMTTADMSKITPVFQKEYGIKVNFWRGSSEDIRDRAIAEHRAGHYAVDVVETAAPDMVAMDRQNIFRPVKMDAESDLIPEAFTKGQDWIGSRVSVVVGAYNTDAIKNSPKTYEDLLNPKYKGDLGIEAASDWWLMTMADLWGEKKAVDFFKKMVATNGISTRKGHTLLANLTASGEVPIAITTYSYKVDQLARKGAPIKRINWDPSVALMTGIGVAAKAPHPYAALLFQEFFVTEAQKILAKLDAVPVNKKYIDLPAGLHLKYVDPVQWVDQDSKWSALYRQIFVERVH